MGRRRRQSEEPGLIDLILDVSKTFPMVGAIIGTISCAAAAYLIWINPKSVMGFGPLIGLLFGILGPMCLLVAGVGLVRTRLDQRLATQRLDRAWSIDAVRGLSWQQFELLVADLFRREGYRAEERGRDAQSAGTGDGGVDLVLTDPKTPGAHYLVQCKQYRAWDVGEPKVREFYGAMAAWQTRCEGIIVTCGRFSQPAQQFAAGKPLRLIDGDGLVRMLNQSNAVAPAPVIAAPASVQAASLQPPPVPTATSTPRCPQCGGSMTRRVASRGARQGRQFWGCTAYPRCKGIINIDT